MCSRYIVEVRSRQLSFGPSVGGEAVSDQSRCIGTKAWMALSRSFWGRWALVLAKFLNDNSLDGHLGLNSVPEISCQSTKQPIKIYQGSANSHLEVSQSTFAQLKRGTKVKVPNGRDTSSIINHQL